jgi:hypothetical protein
MKVQPPDGEYKIVTIISTTGNKQIEGKHNWVKLDNLAIVNDQRIYFSCPYGQVGDHLWVRETWQHNPFGGIVYKAGSGIIDCGGRGWKPSIFMPRWASRITLEITNVRVERLQDISAPDCVNEGINTQGPYDVAIYDEFSSHSIAQFAYLWDSINSKKYPWASNPWVFAIEFKRVENKL